MPCFSEIMKKKKDVKTDKKSDNGIVRQTLLLEVQLHLHHSSGTESQPRPKSMTGPKQSIGRRRINDELRDF
jgi:hypothetical protein